MSALPPIDLGGTHRPLTLASEGWPRRVVLWGGVMALGGFALVGLLVSRSPDMDPPPPALPAVAPPAIDTGASAAAAAPQSAPPTEASSATPPSPPAVAPVVVPALRIAVGNRPSWIEVTEANGRVVVSGVQPPGTELKLQEARPLRLVVGNASSVVVEAQGVVVPLAPNAASDVARLTLD